MDGDDPDAWLAYYCFINRNWAPHQYEELPYREKILVAEFVHREVKSRKEQARKAKSHRRR